MLLRHQNFAFADVVRGRNQPLILHLLNQARGFVIADGQLALDVGRRTFAILDDDRHGGGNTDGEDALYDTAVAIVIKDRKCSTSYIQRKLAIGYNKAARLVEQMEDQGLVSASNHVGKREILVPEQH